MAIFLDLFPVIILIICIIVGMARGFVHSIIGLVGFVLAIVLAWSFCAPLGHAIDTNIVRPWAVRQVLGRQDGMEAEDATTGIDMEKFQQDILSAFGKKEEAGEVVEPEGADAGSLGGYISAFLEKNSITLGASKAVAVIIIFIGTMLLLSIVGLLLKPVLKLPVLKQFNGLLGAVAGAVNGIIAVIVFATAMLFFARFTNQPNEAPFEERVIEKTYIFKHIYEHNPVKTLIEK